MKKKYWPPRFVTLSSGWYTYKQLMEETEYSYCYLIKAVRKLCLKTKTKKDSDAMGRTRSDIILIYWPGIRKYLK